MSCCFHASGFSDKCFGFEDLEPILEALVHSRRIVSVNEPRVPVSASPRSHLAPVSPTGHVQRYP